MANVQLEQGQFAEKVFKHLGIPLTQMSLTKFMAWMQQEGGNWHNSARYNPLNTTLAEPGAGNTGTQGNIKVYVSWQQGIDATVRTLKGSAYTGILANLAGTGDLASFESAVNASPWGTRFPGGGKGGGEGRGPSSIPGGETNLPQDVEKLFPWKSMLDAVKAIWKTLSDPATWFRILKVVGGLALAYLAVRQFSQLASAREGS
jgi:hypothetical protein